ncbi:unnamed protein product [Closterium sp. NIES-64]|nr:unnamed protein product [Closterium sp. NIES-64]
MVNHTAVGVAAEMECTGSNCSPPNPPTAKYPALPLFSQPSHRVALLVMLAPCIALPFSLLFVTPIRPPSPKVAHTGVAVVGGEGGSTPLGWDGMGEPSQARGVAAGEQQARGAPGRAAGAQAAGQLRRPHQRLREEAPGGGLLRREAAGVAAAALSSPSRYQLRAHTGRLGGGLPWREAAGGAAAALSSPSRHQLSPPLRCKSPRQVQVPLASVADSWGREGGSTAAWQSHCSKGEYWDGLGLSRSLAMQQRHLTGPVVAASAAGSTGAAGEGREGEGGISREAALQLPAKLKHPAWTTEESLPPLIPPSLSTSQQPQHHGALHGCGRYSVLFSVVCYIVVCYSVVCYIVSGVRYCGMLQYGML